MPGVEHLRKRLYQSSSHALAGEIESLLAELAGPRGSYDPATRTIALLNNADFSTPLHETAHWALDIYSKIAVHPEAHPELRADMDAVLKWFGVQDLETWNAMSIEQQRPYHDQFARGFETYLMEGQAPIPELQPVFARIKQLMLEIYKSIEVLGVKLTPEIRGVMDRMLGGEAAIKEAERKSRS